MRVTPGGGRGYRVHRLNNTIFLGVRNQGIWSREEKDESLSTYVDLSFFFVSRIYAGSIDVYNDVASSYRFGGKRSKHRIVFSSSGIRMMEKAWLKDLRDSVYTYIRKLFKANSYQTSIYVYVNSTRCHNDPKSQ